MKSERESLVVEPFPNVQGECPMGCGHTLFLGKGGHVTCSWHECPNPGAADELLVSAEAIWPTARDVIDRV